MPLPRRKCEKKTAKEHSIEPNMKKKSSDTTKAAIECLRDTKTSILEPLPNFGMFLSLPTRNLHSNRSSRPHSFRPDELAADVNYTSATNTSRAISCIDVTDGKDNLSRIPLRIKPLVSTPRTGKPTTHKTSSNSFRMITKTDLTTPEPKLSSRRSLELQFQQKKKQIDQLRNEIFVKQKDLSEMYDSLLQLKKQLKANGKDIHLSNIDLLNYEDGWKNHTESSATNSEMDNANSTIQEICKFLMMKRLELVEVLEKISTEPVCETNLHQNIQSIETEMAKLDSINSKNSENTTSSFAKQIKLLQEKLNNKEQKFANVSTELEEIQQKHTESTVEYEKIINDLKEQKKQLENELTQSQMIIQNFKDKTDLYEQHIISLKKRAKESDVKLKKSESKCAQLQKAIRY